MNFSSAFLVKNLIVLMVFMINTLVIALLKDTISSLDYVTLYTLFGIIFFLEWTLIIYINKKFYDDPINDIKKSISYFLGGKNKNVSIKIPKTINPDLNYTITFFNTVLNSLKNIKDEFLSGKAIKGEVELASELQGKLLNKKFEVVPSIDIVAKSKPAGEVGGDSYDIIKQADNYYIYVGDATGHGVGAGFVMVMVNALISGFSKLFVEGNKIVAHTNEILKPRLKSNILMSLLMIRWDEKQKRFFMTGAGHEYLMIYKAQAKKCFRIKSGGVALGMAKDIHKVVKEQEIKFEEDDIFVLYTDGITEAKRKVSSNSQELEMYLEDRLIDAIEKSSEIDIAGKKLKTARTVFNNITIDVSKFMGYKYTQYDDVTLVVGYYKANKTYEDAPAEIPQEMITEWKW